MGSNFKKRIVLDLLIFLSIAVFPWWITSIFVVFGFFFFNSFYEGLFAGFMLDSLYGTAPLFFGKATFVSFAIFLIFFFIIEWIKKRLVI